MKSQEMHLLIAVGSRHDQICSIGAFARAEALAMQPYFKSVQLLEPTREGDFPYCEDLVRPDVILFHSPALYDRKRPWNPIRSVAKLRTRFPRAGFFSVVHEYSEAPQHWRFRQGLILKMSTGGIVHSNADFAQVRKWHSNILRSHLGPTLFFPDLNSENEILNKRGQVRKEMAGRYSLDSSKKWLLHPGLLTGGKGLDFMTKLAPIVTADRHLLIMGSYGPKEKDRIFASEALEKIERLMPGRVSFIDSPPDEDFRAILLSADLVLLPYDVGVSERRSSFLSAMTCAANIWTTVGTYSVPLGIEGTGVFQVSAATWLEQKELTLNQIDGALAESESAVLKRRLKNLKWGEGRSWEKRANSIATFVSVF